MHDRFNRKVWVFADRFTSALAESLVRLSPHTVPRKLSICLRKFDKAIRDTYTFDSNDMAEIYIGNVTNRVYAIFETIPEIMALSEPTKKSNDVIDIMALAQNVTCYFADRADAHAYLELMLTKKL